jgi:hypothetical protein
MIIQNREKSTGLHKDRFGASIDQGKIEQGSNPDKTWNFADKLYF